jgi:hypothetical protein
VLQDAFDQQVSMTKDGKTMKVPLIQAMTTKVVAMALSGNPAFMKMGFQLYEAAHQPVNDNHTVSHSSFELTPEELMAIEKSTLLKGLK